MSQYPKVRKKEKNEFLSLKMKPIHKRLIEASSKANGVPKATVVHHAFDRYFKLNSEHDV